MTMIRCPPGGNSAADGCVVIDDVLFLSMLAQRKCTFDGSGLRIAAITTRVVYHPASIERRKKDEEIILPPLIRAPSARFGATP